MSIEIESEQYRRTTPGSVSRLLHPYIPKSPAGLVDPTHPLASLPWGKASRAFPRIQCTGFSLSAFPKALLGKPQHPWPQPPFYQTPDRSSNPFRVNMSLLKLIGKKAVTKSAVVRGKVAKRLKEAIRLVVARGAHVVKNEQGKERLEFDQSDVGGDKWILSSRSRTWLH